MIGVEPVPEVDRGEEHVILRASEYMSESAKYGKGWRLVGTIPASAFRDAYTYHGADASGASISTSTGHVYNDPYLVLVRSRDARVSELGEKLDAALRERNQASEELEKLRKAVVQLEAEAATSTETIASLSDRLADSNARRSAVSDVKDELEKDIARIREHFGAKALREALGK